MATFNLSNVVYYEDLSLECYGHHIHLSVITIYLWNFEPIAKAASDLTGTVLAIRQLKLISLQRHRHKWS